MASRQRFCKALAVEHRCSTSLPINEAYHYKREDNRNIRYTQLDTNTLRNISQLIFSLESFSLTYLSIEGNLADATLACYSSLSLFCRILTYGDDPIHSIVRLLRQGAQLLIFCIISLVPSMENANHSSHLSQ